MSNFESIFELVSGHEGDLTTNATDPGNWTGGAIGAGACRGTKFGISAAAYPELDIVNLTFDEAKALYRRDYWQRIAGDHLPPSLALLVLDAAINNGVGRAVRWLQEICHVPQDGIPGPRTLEAIGQIISKPGGVADTCSEFQARRLLFMASLPTWQTFGPGWARRLFRLPFEAANFLNGSHESEEKPSPGEDASGSAAMRQSRPH